MNSQTAELEIVDEIPPDLRMAVVADAPDFEEILLERKKLLAKVEKFESVESVDDTPRMQDAKRLRLDLVKCRTGMDRIRKEVGTRWRKRFEAINEMFRPLIAENESAEDFLKESEEFAIRYEASRRAELTAERAPQLQSLGVDAAVYNLGDMTVQQWEITLGGAKLAKENADKELAAQAEREKAEREERELLRRKNEQLMEEQRRKDAEALRERQEIQKKADEAAATARAAQRKVEEKAEGDRKLAAAKLAEERRQKEALEQKEKDRLAEIAAKEAETRKAVAKAARAPAKQKLLIRINEIALSVQGSGPVNLGGESQEIFAWMTVEITKVLNKARDKAESL